MGAAMLFVASIFFIDDAYKHYKNGKIEWMIISLILSVACFSLSYLISLI